MKKVTFAILILLCGCGNPATDQFSSQDKAVAFSPIGGEIVLLELENGNPAPVPVGTHVSVMTDPGGAPDRKVVVSIREGRYQGHSATGLRSEFRLAKD